MLFKALFLPLLFAVALIFVLCLDIVGQTPSPTPAEENEVIRIETELINVPVTVIDRAGKPILDLKRSNFTVYEDGKQQEITDFSTTSAPFEVALLLDTSGSTRGDLELIKRSAQLFIESLRPGDRVSIIAFESSPGKQPSPQIHTRLTDDRSRLKTALQAVSLGNGTPYYDSLIEIMDKVFSGEPEKEFRGRRALVALTDGVDSTSLTDFEEAMTRIEGEGLITYFIKVDTRGFFESELLGDCQTAIRFSMAQIRRYYRLIGAKNTEQAANFCQLGEFERLAVSKALYDLADKEMAQLARSSGGKVFPVGDLSEARNAFRSVAAEIGTNYGLGYYTSNEARDGRFRSIRVEVKGLPDGAQVRAREGYTAR
ncbi:MAG TPA: VWA domain-containing protein [Pyrinomonadaceae bacterium]|nr:VWA domain-containing protein [Pyrinomonadaceae bacterium]HMP66020.1 VWA domain-containing protein [Pyrinomonadaceae bacterium]